MHKELIIATTSQETKLAILEDDELVECYIERHRSQGIVGNIYKGRVTKVLPGMQSAFVDIGLERDAFLYVSDFLEDTEEYDKIVSTVEDEVASLQEGKKPPSAPAASAPAAPPAPAPTPALPPMAAAPAVPEEPARIEPPAPQAPPSVPAPTPAPAPAPVSAAAEPADESGSSDSLDRRGGRRRERDRDRDRDRRGKKPKIPSFETRTYEPRGGEDRPYGPIEVLPGETLKKYSRSAPPSASERREFRESGPVAPVVQEAPAAEATEATEAADAAESAMQALREEAIESRIDAPEPPPADGDDGPSKAPQAPAEVPPVDAPVERMAVESEWTSKVQSPANPSTESLSIPKPEPASEAENADDDKEKPNSEARITDKSDNFRMTHPSSQRRPRRRGGNGPSGGPPSKIEDSRPSSGSGSKPAGPMIAELLREGQEILVQVSKEPLGKKGARITSHIALPGRYLVYMPTVDHVGVSRKIASDEERQRLKRVINENRSGLPGGFIVRTAAEGRDESDFIQDIRFLGNVWMDIRSKSEKRSAPALIHSDLNLVQRTLRDQLTQDFTAIRIDNEQEFATILDFVNKFQPALVNRVKLHLKDTPIFEEYGLNTEIDKALKSKVWLKSGGYIVINQTEALVAIDVNTGKYVGKSNRLEDTIVRTNIDAVHEIVRQIRLRNLGGIIVVDFIDMEEKKNRQRVMQALEEEIRSDRVPSKILQFNDFGLVAITRKRTQPSMERTICTPCSHCSGSGWLKSPETVCYEIQQELRKMSSLLEGKEITIRVNPEVAKALKSGEYVSLIELEELTRKDIVVKSDALLHDEQFDIF